MIRKLIFTLTLLLSLNISAADYPQALLRGDYPDPSILRDGKDFYMTHSPFYYAPGFLIWHSTDLVNWQPLCRALPEYKGSAMAPDLVKCNGRYYIYYPAAGTNWVIWADDIKGPWSKPVDLKISGIDPGHVIDKDGNRWLFTNEGKVTPLTADGLARAGETKKVYDGWVYPKKWKTEGMYLESPKLTYHNGYYYMTSAEGGTAGPATSHMVAAARSKSLFGPWENSPYNPIVHTYSADDNWWSKGHGTLVDDADGNWWIVYHAYANGYHTLGRSTLIEPIEWTSDGWYRVKPLAAPMKKGRDINDALPLSDDFSGKELGLQWTFWKEYAKNSVELKNKSLTVKGKGTTPADGRLLLVTPTDKNYETKVEVNVGKNNIAGLLLFYSERAYAGLISDGKTFTIYKNAKEKQTVRNDFGRRFFVRLHNKGNHLDIQVSKDGNTWKQVAENIDVSSLHHNNYGGFYALRPALVSIKGGSAQFRSFSYGNAVPQEKDMGAYLMVFHKDDTHGLHMALSYDGYSFTALNNGKPIFAGDTIAEQKGIRDPHIYRGPDGAFYLAMTDLHVFAKRDGLRDTEWERGNEYGWGNNRGLVLMKSWDLKNWTRANIRLDKISAAYSEIGCAWAPETTFDEKTGKLMIYFTMRFRNELNRLYYVYVNDDFNRFESLPQLLFEYPDKSSAAIDGDITKIGDRYHLFYVSHEDGAGVKQAVSDEINRGYRFSPKWIDQEPKACEAPNLWKRIGEDKWVLMYDCYGIKTHNFGFMETTDFDTFTPIGHFNEGVMKATNFVSPKHGAVIHLTEEEADRLAAHWGLDYRSMKNQSESFKPNKNNPVLPGRYADPEVLYSENTGKYYIYPTSDGFDHWSGYYFKAFSSTDLKNWKDEGVILDLKKDVKWADRNAWAPCIIEKKDANGKWKYYYYYTAAQKIGVAVADSPTGPFKDSGKPLIDFKPEGVKGGQNIDPDVFTDPETGKSYLYWGNGYLAVCELNDDMVSIKPNTVKTLISRHPDYCEGTYVFYRNGKYYFTWSKNDTRSPDYQVRYVIADSPTAKINPSESKVILFKDAAKRIFGTGHHSVLQLPGKDEWRIVYHRFLRPDGIKLGRAAGYNREVCIDKLEFNADGTIKPVEPTI